MAPPTVILDNGAHSMKVGIASDGASPKYVVNDGTSKSINNLFLQTGAQRHRSWKSRQTTLCRRSDG